MSMFTYSTRPDDATLKVWVQRLEPKTVAFLREHQLQIPFWYYGYPGKYAEAACQNEDIKHYCHALPMAGGSKAWHMSDERKHPTMRWEFEMVVAIGGLEVMGWAKNKDWGPLDWVAPVLPDDPVDDQYLSCWHNPATSKWHKRREQRWWIRHKLPPGKKDLYAEAMRCTKGEFVGRLETGRTPIRWIDGDRHVGDVSRIEDVRFVKVRGDGARLMKGINRIEPDSEKAKLIRRTFGMTAAEFWDACRCRVMLSQRRMKPQLNLF